MPFPQQMAQPMAAQVLPPMGQGGVSYDPTQIPQQGMQVPPQGVVGVPGTQQAQFYYPGQPQPFQNQTPPQQMNVPVQQSWQPPQQQQGMWAQQPYQQQPQQQAPQQWQQPQQQGPQAPVQLHDGAVLDGPGVPPELRGRTWGDARRLYQALSADWLQRNPRPATPAQQSLQQQGFYQQPQAQAPQQFQQQPQQWQQPQAQGQAQSPFMQHLTQAVQQVVGQELAPMRAQSQAQGIMQARNIAATAVPDFQYLEPDIMTYVAGASPENLQRPETWQLAANAARGARMLAGQYQPQAQAPRAPQIPGRQPMGPGAGVPAQPLYGFFTEGPSAPNISQYGGMGPRQATQEDQFYANKFGMDLPTFMSWKHGAPSAAGGSGMMGAY